MKRMIAIGTLLAVTIILGSAGSPAASTAQEPTIHRAWLPAVLANASLTDPARPGGRLIVGQGQEPETLYIYGGSMLSAAHVQNSLYDGPIDTVSYVHHPVILDKLPRIEDGDGRARVDYVTVEPGHRYVDPETQEVVTATETVADLPQLTVKHRLVPGLRWEDGTPLTAADSAFSARLACDPDSWTSKFLCERTAHYVARDERTVEWQGLPGFTDPTYYTNFYTPLPRHQRGSDGMTMSEMEAGSIAEDEVFHRRPLSYGPFKIGEWADGDFIRLERNENYWRASEGLPSVDEVIHHFISDSNSLLAALKAGEVDVATRDGIDISQFDALEAAKDVGELTPHYVAGTVWEHLDFNLDPVDDRPAFGACQAVRRAIALGTDRQTMVDVILMGQSSVMHTFVPEEHWAYPPTHMLATYPFAPELAMALLDDAGFIDTDDDGVREAQEDITCTIVTNLEGDTIDHMIPAGTRLELTVNTTQGNVMREETTLFFQANMIEIGVRTRLEYLPAYHFFADGPDGPLFGRRYDLGEFAWLTGVQPRVDLHFCTEIPSEENSWSGQNQTGWCDPEYERVSRRAVATLERGDALPLYHRAQQIFTEQVPVLPLFQRVMVTATRPDLINFRPDPTVNSETWNIEEWRLGP